MRDFQFIVRVPVPTTTSAVGRAFSEELALQCIEEAMAKSLDPIARSALVERVVITGTSPDARQREDSALSTDCGLPRLVTIYADGSWHYPADYDGEDGRRMDEGKDFRSLLRFIANESKRG